MTSLLIIAVLVTVCLLLGGIGLRVFLGKDNRFDGDWLDFAFASTTLGVAIIGWISFVLAELRLFSVLAIGIIWLIVFTSLILLWYRRGRPKPQLTPLSAQSKFTISRIPRQVEWLLLLVWAIAAVWLFFRPHQFLQGAADAGVYVNLSAEIARTGQITIDDDMLGQMDPELAQLFLRELSPTDHAPYYLMPAFYVMAADSGEITPQFYHLHPVWQAIANGLAGQNPLKGASASLAMTGLWTFLSTVAIYLLARSLFGWQVAMLALAGLSINALQVWFARYPTTEAMSQLLLWAGLWAVGNWLSHQKPANVWALLAGLCFGQFFLLRIDTAVIVPILGFLILWLWLSENPPSGWAWFFTPLLVLSLHSLVHGYWQSRPYFMGIYGLGFQLLKTAWIIPLAAILLGGLVLWILYRFRGKYSRLQVYKRPFLILLIGLFLAWAGYNWFIRPYADSIVLWNDPFSSNPIPIIDHENLLRLGWYLSPVGIWLGIAGICVLIWQVNRRTIILLSITLLFTLIFIQNIRANPLQVYTMRRFAVATIPLFVLGAVAFINWLLSFHKHWLTGLSVLLAGVWLGSLLWSARGFVTQVDFVSLPEQLSEIDSQLADNAILLFNDQAPIGQGDLWGTPMRFLFNHDVYSLRNLTPEREVLLNAAVAQWQADGHSVYWIDPPSAQVAYRPAGEWTAISEYNIAYDRLEQIYDHKPTQVVTEQWLGTIWELEPAAP